jgi:hypothetical protein
MDPAHQAMMAALRSIRGFGAQEHRGAARATFDALEVQRVPLYKAFYQTCPVESHWQLPPMQKYRV